MTPDRCKIIDIEVRRSAVRHYATSIGGSSLRHFRLTGFAACVCISIVIPLPIQDIMLALC